MKTTERDLREMLQRRAKDMTLAPPTQTLLRRALHRRTRARGLVLASAVLALVVVVPVGVSITRAPDRPRDVAAEPPISTDKASDRLRLVSYTFDTQQEAPHPHDETGEPITLADLREHAECMRAQGFDIPDPTKTPDGWSLIIDDPAGELDFHSREFREAMFVTCGPLGAPLSGDIVIGGPREKIDLFMACMSAQGFDLPEPVKDTSVGYDIDEWEFDLHNTGIDTSTSEWNRAMFVTCAPIS